MRYGLELFAEFVRLDTGFCLSREHWKLSADSSSTWTEYTVELSFSS